MIHQTYDRNFRLSAWPFAPGAEQNFLRRSAAGINTSTLLKVIFEALYKSHRPLMFPNTFTLVNVVYKNIRSYGQSSAPPESVRSGAISFTFALSSTSKYAVGTSSSMIRNGNVVFWGPDVTQSNDFLTVNITQTQLQKAGLSNVVLSALNYLYAAVGGATKNWVKIGYKARIPASYGELAQQASSTLNVSMTQCFTKIPINNWQYNARIWSNAPNLLNAENFSPMFWLYYTTYLLDDWDDVEELTPFLRAGLNDLEQFIAYGSSDITPNLRAVHTLVLRANHTSKGSLRTSPLPTMLAIRDRLVSSSKEQAFYDILADKDAVVTMLLTSKGRGTFRQRLIEEGIEYE
jgi:hypothetical protein